MTIIEAMARAAWEAREQQFPEHVRVPFEHGFAQSDAITIIMVRAALAEAEKRGWVMVPKEPTRDMRDKGEDAISNCEDSTQDSFGSYNWTDATRAMFECWKDMIAARPALESEDK